MHCPNCQSTQIIKNGGIHTGKPNWKCKACSRQFAANPSHHRIKEETKQLIDTLLLERISLAGIVRVTGVSARWMQSYCQHQICLRSPLRDSHGAKNGA